MESLPSVDDEELLELRNASRGARQHEIANIIEWFIGFRWYHTMSVKVVCEEKYLRRGCNCDSAPFADEAFCELEVGPPNGCSKHAFSNAEAILRFIDRWVTFNPSYGVRQHPWDGFVLDDEENWGFDILAEYGWVQSLRLFVGNDPSVVLKRFGGPFEREMTTVDNGLFLIQPERKTCLVLNDYDKTELSLVELAAFRGVDSSDMETYVEEDSGIDIDATFYLCQLEAYFNSNTEQLLVDYFSEIQKKSSTKNSKLAAFRSMLLSDDVGLEGSLAVLDFLVKEQGMVPPSAFDTIRWRRCGVLRWLVEEGMIDLQRTAKRYPQTAKVAPTLQVLGGQKVPPDLALGKLLCFCAIEFDDLQSLLWLAQEQNVDVQSANLYGWNISHACAFFGRSEIAISLYKLGWFKPKVVAAPCKRKPYHQALAVHIAVEKGFTFVAKVLMKAGCPTKDARGRGIAHYANRCNIDFVVDFVQSVGRPSLEESVRELLYVIDEDSSPYEKTKEHLLQTRCLDFDLWRDCQTWQDPGPLGKSFTEILDRLARTGNPSFVAWLCAEFSRTSLDTLTGKVTCNYSKLDRTRVVDITANSARLGVDKLHGFAIYQEDEKICNWLHSVQDTELFVVDQSRLNPIFVKFQRESYIIQARLQSLRATWLRRNILVGLRQELNRKLLDLLLYVHRIQVVEKVASDLRDVIDELFKDSEGIQPPNKELSSTFWLVLNDGSINADIDISSHMVLTKWRSATTLFSPRLYGRLYIALAAGGYEDLLFWLVENSNNFDSQKCCDAVRVAAFAGHMNIVWRFIRTLALGDSLMDLYHAAFLGSVEGGRLKHIENLSTSLVSRGLSLTPDPILELNDSTKCAYARCKWSSSLAVAAVHGLLDASKDGTAIATEGRLLIKWLIETNRIPPLALLRATEWILSCTYELPLFRGAEHLVNYIITNLKCEWWRVKSLRTVTKYLLSLRAESESDKSFVRKWLKFMLSIGQDIQIPIDKSSYNERTRKTIRFDNDMQKILSEAKERQRSFWSQFQVIKDGRDLSIIQDAVGSGSLSLVHRDNGGLLISHLAAAYDRPDILMWLVEEKGMSLDDTDWRGRDVLTVARASNAKESILWINRRQAVKVSVFVSKRCHGRAARRKHRLLLNAALKLQAWFRATGVRSRFHSKLLWLKERYTRFHTVWNDALRACESIVDPSQGYHSWGTLKVFRCDYTGQLEDLIDGDDMISDRHQKLSVATENALEEDSEANANENTVNCNEETDSLAAAVDTQVDVYDGTDCFKRIKFTKDVVKWLRVADPKYKEFFVRRVRQLSAGENGRKLAKRLVGCQSLIFESYLEQKAGHRILWTPSSDDSILIWFVASHDRVPRYLKLIDDSENRSSRQLKDATTLLSDENDCHLCLKSSQLGVQLDPRSNTPLKLFEVLSHQIEHVSDQNWKPQLYLTQEERDIVETPGTVLVLGRSGTGKTVCIANRMHYDRHRLESDIHFSQLFVARSQRLCTFVKKSVEESTTKSTFATFDQLLGSLERRLPTVEGSHHPFMTSQKMDYQRFKRDVHTPTDSVDALIVWSNIRSFIKGSIEAQQKLQPDKILSRSEYMELGKRRCRLPTEQRQTVYEIFQRYNQHMKDNGLWDEMDRAASIIERLEHSRRTTSPEFETVRRSKVYVDEVQVCETMLRVATFCCTRSLEVCVTNLVIFNFTHSSVFQDYTQAEIYIFFLLSGPGDLFLAGDPCQSVVEGVDFRFEDIRSVGYFVCGRQRRELIPDKPKTVNVNFRSHSGILDTAAAVLNRLFAAFPDSAKQLKEDRGLFAGPRPGVFQHVSYQRLQNALVTPGGGAVILTHDALVLRCKDALVGYPLVYGIREAKGLEFHHVVLLDFFCELPLSLQKAWRDLLLGRTTVTNFSTQFPEIEGQLKLLYTAVTRSMDRLFFAESRASIAGDAFVRWITTCSVNNISSAGSAKQRMKALATRSAVDDVEKMRQTPDDWRSTGFDNAIMAESGDDLDAAKGWMEKALYCFQQANDSELASKARLYRASLRFRSLLYQNETNVDALDLSDLEPEAARLVKHLLKEQLINEAVAVCEAAIPFLEPYSQKKVRDLLIGKLSLNKDVDEAEK